MPMEFIDSNCMLGQWKKNTGICFYTANDLISFMDKSGISRCVVFGSLAKYSHIQTGNDMLLKEIKNYDRLIPCAVAMPHHTGEFLSPEEFVKYLADNNIRAVRIFPAFHGISLYTWVWEDLFSELELRKIPVFIDFSIRHWSEEINWEQIKNFCETFPALPFVLVRMGVKADRYIYPLFKKFDSLYLETSYYIVNNGIEKMVRNFGAGRLIFGTGMPVYSPNPPIAMVCLANIKEDERDMIAGKNLMNLLEGVNFDAK
ncbi:MAG: amidohydrolase family protein [Firmicutes bacterium]|nr:amidohydrolase family protein [Bacillota bacterium]